MTAADDIWAIQEVTRSSGVSSRTLRHYDNIGLLRPAFVGPGGVRFYGPDELVRLQRILVMRELDMGLTAIKAVLDEQVSQVAALRRHQAELARARERLGTVEKTVERTIHDLERGRTMKAEDLFEGFDAQAQKGYEEELVADFGPGAQAAIDESWQRISTLSKAEAEALTAAFPRINADVCTLMLAGASINDPRVQELIGEHYSVVNNFWTPNAEQYVGLGQLYCDDPRFRVNLDDHHPGLAEFFRDAMSAYARRCLS